jgi:hypothetical protein
MQQNSRSPLKDKPHRHPGQSLEEEREDLFIDKVVVYIVVSVTYVAMACLEVNVSRTSCESPR